MFEVVKFVEEDGRVKAVPALCMSFGSYELALGYAENHVKLHPEDGTLEIREIEQ